MTDEIPESCPSLDQALRRLEESEVPFYDGVRLVKQAAGELRQLLASRVQYMNAKRALKVMAAQPCESGDVQPLYADCESAIAADYIDETGRCWPCYARHVINGGTP